MTRIADDAWLLTAAAERLARIDLAHPAQVDPGVRLHCLNAVHLLQTAGAELPEEPEPADPRETDALLVEALIALSGVSPEMFAVAEVVDAAAEARFALDLCAPPRHGHQR